MSRGWLLGVSVAAALGCARAGSAGQAAVADPSKTAAVCARRVELITAEMAPPKPFRELRTLDVTCHSAFPRECDGELVARGCDVGADAVWLKRTSYIAVTRHGLMTKEALAVAFTH